MLKQYVFGQTIDVRVVTRWASTGWLVNVLLDAVGRCCERRRAVQHMRGDAIRARARARARIKTREFLGGEEERETRKKRREQSAVRLYMDKAGRFGWQDVKR